MTSLSHMRDMKSIQHQVRYGFLLVIGTKIASTRVFGEYPKLISHPNKQPKFDPNVREADLNGQFENYSRRLLLTIEYANFNLLNLTKDDA